MSVSGRWALVEKTDGTMDVVNTRSIVNSNGEVKVGELVTVATRGGVGRLMKLIATSDTRQQLESQHLKKEVAEANDTEPNIYDEVEVDFSPSGSSWGPDVQNSSDTEDEVENEPKKMKIDSIKKQYTNNRSGRKTLTPTLKAEPVIPRILNGCDERTNPKQFANKNNKRKPRGINKNRMVQQALADSTRSHASVSPRVTQLDQRQQTSPVTVNINVDELNKVKKDIKQFREMISTVRSTLSHIRSTLSTDHLYETVYASAPCSKSVQDIPETNNENQMMEITIDTPRNTVKKEKKLPKDPRSIQAIKQIRYGLIERRDSANKANTSNGTPKIVTIKQQQNNTTDSVYGFNSSDDDEANDQEMVPIGTGTTFVPKYVYSKINWDSYTIATRKLLMAVFSRRVLATHSLTGKASPAFTDKPAKLCLDPKKVYDIVVTVTQKCKVKETLVRSAITTKCADENKMSRIKAEKAKMRKSTNGTPFRIMTNKDKMKQIHDDNNLHNTF